MPITNELENDVVTAVEPAMRRVPPRAAVGYDTLFHDEQPILSIRASVPKADASTFVAEALRDIRAFMQEHHLRAAGPPFSICRGRADEVDVEAGWPVTSRPVAGTSRIHAGSLPRSLTGKVRR
jgi:formate-dependent phosphoribosylglycinamide formyltransferase (GAR transformylase)